MFSADHLSSINLLTQTTIELEMSDGQIQRDYKQTEREREKIVA